MIIRSAYSPKTGSVLECSGPGLTKQQFKDECDINLIMAKVARGGVVNFRNKHEPQYGDATAPDFLDAMNTVVQAEEMFMDLPAKLRKRFENDPAQFLAFVDDVANRDEAISIGLISAPKQSEVPTVPVANASEPAALAAAPVTPS